MQFKTPAFWYTDKSLSAYLLKPIAFIYSLAVQLRLNLTNGIKMKVPVICVGNLVMGGAGKTPTVIAIAELLIKAGKNPHILSRGYGASIKQAIKVNPDIHSADQVGDEPLLLARAAPTWVYKNRTISGKRAIEDGADILILDDGFQNPAIHKDLSFIVIDELQGFGNCEVFPAGPLREDCKKGLQRADAIISIGKGDHLHELIQTKSVIAASIHPKKPDPKRVLAFTGLGFPDKFYATLSNLKYEIADRVSFPDHHPYNDSEMERLIINAEKMDARLITTAKDFIRIPKKFHTKIDVLEIELKFDNEPLLIKLLMDYIK